jgi:hypothetical protein
MGRRLRGAIGEHWDPRKLRRIREDGWFRQHEAEMIAAARLNRAASAVAAPKSTPSESQHDQAVRRATAIITRAMDLIRDADRASTSGPKP